MPRLLFRFLGFTVPWGFWDLGFNCLGFGVLGLAFWGLRACKFRARFFRCQVLNFMVRDGLEPGEAFEGSFEGPRIPHMKPLCSPCLSRLCLGSPQITPHNLSARWVLTLNPIPQTVNPKPSTLTTMGY